MQNVNPDAARSLAKNPFDVHFYYTPEQRDSAYAIRDAMMKKFPWLRFHPPHDEPV